MGEKDVGGDERRASCAGVGEKLRRASRTEVGDVARRTDDHKAELQNRESRAERTDKAGSSERWVEERPILPVIRATPRDSLYSF